MYTSVNKVQGLKKPLSIYFLLFSFSGHGIGQQP